MLHNTDPDFYAVIRKESKYSGQDGGKPFPVTLVHDMSGYLWNGLGNRYRIIDLWLLRPSEDPTAKPRDEGISLVFDDTPATEEEAETGYQAGLQESQWFTPLPHQGIEGDYFYINREGRRLSEGEVVSIRGRRDKLKLVTGE